jgi:hypothetical protein
VLIEQAEAMGEPPEDSQLLFSVLYAFWVANYVAFSGDVMRSLAARFLALAEKQGTIVPLMIGHGLMAISLAYTGDITDGRTHHDQALALYDPAKHRPLAMRLLASFDMADQENTESVLAAATLARSCSPYRNQKFRLASLRVSFGISLDARTLYFWTAAARPAFIRPCWYGIATSCHWVP